jgi:peptide/nickel transport system substrate-binding protein
VLLGGLAGFSWLWYQETARSTGTEPAFGGVYVEGVAGAPSRINPLFAAHNGVDQALVALVFAGLTRLDDQGRPFPDLAETWTVSPDGLVYSFTLRPGLQWHDGAPLTADDVVFTYELLRAAGLAAPPPLARVLAGTKILDPDDRTVRIELAQPFSPLPAFLSLGILPAHLLGNTSATAIADQPFNTQPVGAGPYRLEELTPERAVLIANPSHHLGQPFIQRLELRFYRDDGLVFAALKSSEVDGALFAAGLSPNDRREMERRSNLRFTSLPTSETVWVFFNLRQPLFQDRRLRQALFYALDREALIEALMPGRALPADSALPAGSWAFVPSLQRYGYDAGVASMLMNEAGWRAAEGAVRTRGATTLDFSLSVNNDPARLALAQELARHWEEAGVRVTVEGEGTTVLVRDLLEPRAFEATLFSQVAEADPDPYAVWHSSQTGQRGANLASLRDDRIDRLLEEGRLASPTRRREIYAEFQELFAQEVPAIPLYTPAALYVQHASLRGVRVGYLHNPGARFWQVNEWHLRTR